MSSKTYKYILLAFSLITIVGCNSTRNRQKKSKIYMEQVSTKEMKNLILNNQRESQEALMSIKKVEATSKIGKFSGKVADPLKPATVEEEKKEGKTIRTYTNWTNVITEDEVKKQNTIDSLTIVNNEKESTITELNQKIDTLQKKLQESKNLEVERTSGNIPWWLWIILALLGAGYIWYSRTKKTYMPWKWFSKKFP